MTTVLLVTFCSGQRIHSMSISQTLARNHNELWMRSSYPSGVFYSGKVLHIKSVLVQIQINFQSTIITPKWNHTTINYLCHIHPSPTTQSSAIPNPENSGECLGLGFMISFRIYLLEYILSPQSCCTCAVSATIENIL